MLTAESFVEFDAEKVKSFMELAEQVKYIKQMHLVCDTFKDPAVDPLGSWGGCESLQLTYMQLLVRVDAVKAFKKARSITMKRAQTAFVDVVMQMSITRMHFGDYTVVIGWLSKLIAWMPTVLVGNPLKKSGHFRDACGSELAVNRVDECLKSVNEALLTCYSVALLSIKLKAILAHSADDTEIVDLFNSFKPTGEKDSMPELCPHSG